MDDNKSRLILSSKKPRFPIILIVILTLAIISGLLLAYLLRDIDWTLVRQTSPGTLLLILLLTVLTTFTYTFLVYLLIRRSGYVATFWKTFLILSSSLSANYVTPIKVGIPLRIYLYNHFIGIPVALGTALVTVEIFVGMLVPAFIAIISITFLFPALGITSPAIMVSLLLVILFLILQLPIEKFYTYLEQLPFFRFTSRLARFIQQVQNALRQMSLITILWVVVLDLIMVGLQVVRLWLVLSIFGPPPSFTALLAVFTISVTVGNLSMIPMGLGVRDVSFTLLLVQLGVPNEIALSAAVIQRLFAPGVPLVLGLITMNILGVSELLKQSDGTSITWKQAKRE